MKFRAILTCFLVSTSLHAQASKLPPLKEWINVNPNWGSRSEEATYLYARCSAALTVMAAYFAANARNDSNDLAIAYALNSRAKSFTALSLQHGYAAGATYEFLDRRLIAMSRIYTQDAVSNKQLYNNAFAGSFNEDIDICTGLTTSQK